MFPTLRAHRAILHRLMIALLAVWQIGQPLRGATFDWNQTGGTFGWNQNGNWTTVGFPNAPDDIVNLNTLLTGPLTVNLNQPITAGVLNIGDTTSTNSVTLASGGAAGYLLFDVTSGGAAITKALGANANDVISAPIVFNDPLVVTNNSASGSLTLSGSLRSVASNLTLGGSGALAAGSIDVTGVITTSGNLIKAGAGTARLSAANTYAGATQVNAGTLILNNAASLPIRSAITIASGATLDAQLAATFGSLAGAGLLTNTTGTARTLTVGRDDTSTIFMGRIAPTTAANIALTKIGAGTLTLQPQGAVDAGSYTGNTVINGGTLALDTSSSSLSSAFLAVTPLQVTGGNFQLIGRSTATVSQTVGALTVGATGGSITLTPNGGTSTTLITGGVTATASGGTLLVNAPSATALRVGTAIASTALNGRLVFSDGTANTFNWAFNNNAAANNVSGFTPTTALVATGGANTTPYILSAGQTQSGATTIGTLKLSSSSGTPQNLDLSTFTMTLGGGTTSTPGAILIDGMATWNINGTGSLTSSADLIFQQYNTSSGITVNAGISGTGTNLVKAGPGLLTLAGTNTFTGTIFVNGGTLSFNNVAPAGAGSLGNGSTTAVTIRDGATLQYTGPTGTISGAATTAGAHTYNLPGGNATIEVTNSATELTLNGVISGAGGYTKTGAGTLTIGVSSTFTGPLFINAGTLKAGGNFNVTSGTSPVTVGAGGTLDINGTAANNTTTIGSLSGSGTVINNNSTAGKTLAVGGDNTSTTFTGTFAAGAAAGNTLTKTGSGVFTLAPTANAWTGNKNINGGVLRFGVDQALNTSGSVVIASGAGISVLDLNGFDYNATTGANQSITFGGTAGTTTSQGMILLPAGSTLTLGGGLNYNATGNPLASFITSTGGDVVLSATRTITVGDSSSVLSTAAELNINAPISGAGFGITKSGLGNLLLGGANTYTGTTTLNAGRVFLDYTGDNTSKLGTGGLALLGGGLTLNGNASANTLQTVASTTFASGGNVTVTLTPGGSQQVALNMGALTRAAGAGTARLVLPPDTQRATNGVVTSTANDAATGLVGTGGGWLTVTSGGVTNFGTVSSGNIIAITPSAQDAVTNWLPGQNITDASGFTGTLDTETSINSLRFNAAGPSTVNIQAGGLLRLASGGILQTSNVTGGVSTISGGRIDSASGNELIFTTDSATQRMDVTSQISGASLITKTGAGTLRLAGFNNATGAVSIQAGTLELTGGTSLGDTAAVTLVATGGVINLSLLNGQAETIGALAGGGANSAATVAIGNGSNLTINSTAATTYSGAITSGDTSSTLIKSGGSTLTLDTTAHTFAGNLVINQGQVTLGNRTVANFATLGTLTINSGALVLDFTGGTEGPDKLNNAAPVTLINVSGASGLRANNDRTDSSKTETLGAVTLLGGANTITADHSSGATTGTQRAMTIALGNITRSNQATLLAHGRNLGTNGTITSPGHTGRITTTSTGLAVGGGGAAGSTTISIVPWIVGDATTAGLGNSFVAYDTNGFRPLDTTAEYEQLVAGGGTTVGNNVRLASGTSLTLSAGTHTLNSLLVDNTAATAITLAGAGAGDALNIQSGAMLFLGSNATPAGTVVSGFNNGITVGAAANEYIAHVINTAASGVDIQSNFTTTGARLTKSGAGTLILSGTGSTYTGVTTVNQGVLQIAGLNNLGNSGSGGLLLNGGTIRFGSAFDLSSIPVSLGVTATTTVVTSAGGTFDTNGFNVSFANAVGGGLNGGFTKAGTGNLTLNAAITSTGATAITGGRLITDGGNNRLPTSAGLTMSNTSALQLGGASASNQTVTELVGVATSSIVGGNATVSTLTVNQSTSTSYLGFLGGAGTNENNLALVKTGPGTLSLGAVASTFTGGLTINAGTVIGGNNANTFGASSNVITLSPTGVTDAVLNPFNSPTYANPITVTNAGGGSGAAVINGSGTGGGSPVLSGPITLTSKDLIISKTGTTGTFTLTGGITGTGNLVIDNFGTTGVITLSTTAVNNTGSIKNAGIGSTATTTISADIGANVINIIQDSATSALTLSGVNILYTGATTVNQGTLSVTGSTGAALATTAINVAGGATLNTQNTVGQIINLTGAGNLNLGAGSGTTTLGLDVGSTSNYDRINLTGAATTANTVRLNLNGLSGFGVGTYNLITATSGLTGATYALGSLSGFLTGVTLNLTSSDSSVDLVSAAAPGDFYWKGAFGNSWSGLSGLNTNWATDFAGTQGTITANGTPGTASSVIFSASGQTGTAISTTLDGNFSIKDLTVNNAVGSGPVASVTIAAGLTGSNLTLTPVSVSAGINIQTGAPSAVTISAPVILGAAQTWTVTDAATVLTASGGVTGGAGNSLTKDDAGILQLTGAGLSTYSGDTFITNGVLRAGSATAFSANSTHNVGATGTLRLNAFNNTIGALAGASGAIVENGGATNITLTAGGNNANTTFSGTTQNGGASTLALTKTGTGTLILNGAYNHTGATTVNGGTLRLSGAASGTTAYTVNNAGSVLQIGASTGISSSNTVSITANTTLDLFGNSATIGTLTNVATSTITNTGAGTGTDTLSISPQSITVSALVTDGATRKTALRVNNANTATQITTNTANTFSGGLILTNNVSGTRLAAGTITGTPWGSGPITIGEAITDKAGIFFATAGQTFANPIIFNTALGTDRVGVRVDATTTISGTVTANLAPATFTSNTSTTNGLTITGQVTGANGLVIDITSLSAAATSFTTTLNNVGIANDYAGDTIINLNAASGKSATLALGAANQLPNGAGKGNVIVNSNGTGVGTLSLGGFSDTINGLSGNGIVDGISGTPTLTAGDGDASATFSGVLQNTAGTLSLVKIGTGTQTLSGTNTLSGSVSSNGGVLAFAASANLGDASATNTLGLDGGTLRLTASGNVDMLGNRVLTLGGSGGTLDVPSSTGILTFTGGINALSTGALIKTGSGAVVIPGTTAWASGNNVTVTDGTLRAGFGTGGIANLTVGGTGNMSFTNSLAQALTLSGGLNLSAGASLGFELSTADADPLISLNDQIISTAAANVAGVITLNFSNLSGFGAGNYNLIASALGGLTPTGASYVLGTAPAGYNYTINQTPALISLSVVSFVPRYWTNSETTGSWATLNGTGPFTSNWSTNVAGTTNYGATPTSADTVIFSADSVIGTSVSTTLDGSYTVDGLQTRAGSTPTVTSIAIAQGTSGTLTLAPTSTSGGVVVGANAGALTISAPVTVSNANVASQTWNVDGTGANGSSLTISGNVAFNANVVKNGAGAVTLSGSNTGNGNFTLSAGTLNLNSATALGGAAGTLTLAPGVTIDNTSGSAVTMTAAKPMTWNSFTFAGSNNLDLGAGAVSLALNTTVTTTAGALTAGGTISDGGSNRSLGKDGSGTLVVGGAVGIGGNLAVTAGTGTFNGATNTIGGSVTASGAAFTMNGNSTIGNGVSVTAGAATLNGANTITGNVAVTGGTLTLGGANSVTGNASVATGTLNLNAANTIGGGVTVTSGLLNIGHAGGLGAGPLVINGGSIDNASGSAMTLAGSPLQTWGGNYTFVGTNNLNAGTGNVTLAANTQITVTANTLTEGGVIDDGVSTFGITKAGAGTLTLSAANTYGGATTINQGRLVLATSQSLAASTNTLVFGASAGSTATGTLDLNSASATFGGAATVQTNSATANTIEIGTGQTLRLNNSFTVGYNSTGNSTTRLNVTGLGTFTLGAAGQPTNANVQIGNGQTNAISNAATLDLTGIATFYANLGTGTFRVGDPTDGTGTSAAGSTLILAPTSTIIATTITSDSPDSGVTQAIKLGTGTNELQATTITIGGAANRAIGTLDFLSGTGTVKIRDLAGTGRATMNVQNGNAATGANISGTVNFAGRGADLLLGTLTIGGRSAGTTASGTGSFTYDTVAPGAPGGVGLDATTISLASRTGTTLTTGNVTGTLNIGASATIGTLTMATNSSSASTTGDAIANVNISGGTNTIGTVTMGVNTVSAATGNGSDTISTLTITGGTTTVSTAFSMGAQNSAANAATTVNTATSTLNISAGSLILSGTTDLRMGATTLDANNAATADINITGTGLLRVGGNITTAIFAGSTVTNTITLNGGTLDLDGGNIGASGALITNVNLQSGTLQNLAQLNNGATFVKSTPGILVLAGTTNGWTGDTTFATGGGTIRLGSGTAIPDGTGKGNLVTTNGTVDMNGFNETVNGLIGTGVVDNLATATTGTLTVGAANTSSTFSGTLQNTVGTLALNKTGTGTLTLNSASTFSGGTTISGGILQVDNGSALGSGSITFNGSGTSGAVRLQVAGGQTLANAIVIGPNNAASGRGMIEAIGTGTATITGPITINNSAAAGGHFAGVTGNTLVISGAITASVPVVHRIGTVVYSGGGTYSNMTIGQDTVQLGANNGLSTSADVLIGSSAAGFIDLAGFNQSLAAVTKGGFAATIGNSSTSADSTLTITGTSSFAGVIQNTVGAGTMKTNLGVNGGALTLTAANTYTGTTTVNSGSLTLTAGGAVGGTSAVSLTGAAPSFSISGISASSITIGSLAGVAGSTVTLGNRTLNAGGDNTTTTFAGDSSGTGGLTKQGTGTMILTGSNAYSGATTISAGVLQVGTGGTVGTLGTGSVVNNGSLIFNRSDSITQSAPISGTGSVTQNGAGVLVQSGSNTYTGGTFVTTGTLLATNTTGSATGTGAVSVGATGILGGTGFIAPTTGNITIDGTLDAGLPSAVAGSSLSLNVSGGGTLALNGATLFQLFSNANTGTLNANTAADRVVVNAPDWTNVVFGASSTLTITTGLTATSFVAGDSWKIFDWVGVAAGTVPVQGTNGFSSITAPTLDVNLGWDYSNLFTTGTVSVIVVPEPSRAMLLMLGLLGLLMRRRRK